jgi:uncharacterized protein YhhL (DUF1145 family)
VHVVLGSQRFGLLNSRGRKVKRMNDWKKKRLLLFGILQISEQTTRVASLRSQVVIAGTA